MILGHVIVVAMAFLIPLAIVSLGHEPIQVMAVSFALMLMVLAVILGGDAIAGRKRPAKAFPSAAGRPRHADSSIPRHDRTLRPATSARMRQPEKALAAG